ncbi:MAG: hypothetical protein WA020_03430, partial [Candidatus Acidiferrales bacterium]
TAQGQQACRATEGCFPVAAHFHFKPWSSGAFLAENERFRMRWRFFWLNLRMPKKLLELLGFSENGAPLC